MTRPRVGAVAAATGGVEAFMAGLAVLASPAGDMPAVDMPVGVMPVADTPVADMDIIR
jgi:hypothetical protein